MYGCCGAYPCAPGGIPNRKHQNTINKKHIPRIAMQSKKVSTKKKRDKTQATRTPKKHLLNYIAIVALDSSSRKCSLKSVKSRRGEEVLIKDNIR